MRHFFSFPIIMGLVVMSIIYTEGFDSTLSVVVFVLSSIGFALGFISAIIKALEDWEGV